MPSPDSSALNHGELVIPGRDGLPLVTVRRDGDLVTVAVHARRPDEPAWIAPAEARELGAALTYLAHLAATGGEVLDPGELGPLTIADEVKVSAWADAAGLIRLAEEAETDLDGFHKLEENPDKSWMPQALAVIAADLLGELTEAVARLSQFGKKATPREILAERVHIIRHM
jgi:hypothetical protein